MAYDFNQFSHHIIKYLCVSYMFRQIAAIFLLIAFTAQVFNRTVIVLDYNINTAAFAKNCENKAKPMMHCNGKCQMMKKLKEEEKKEQQSPERKADNKNEVVSSKSFFTTLSFQKLSLQNEFPSYFNPSISKGISSEFFHPPGLA